MKNTLIETPPPSNLKELMKIETPPPSNCKRTPEQNELLNIEAQIRALMESNKDQIRKKQAIIRRLEGEIDTHSLDLERLETFNIK